MDEIREFYLTRFISGNLAAGVYEIGIVLKRARLTAIRMMAVTPGSDAGSTVTSASLRFYKRLQGVAAGEVAQTAATSLDNVDTTARTTKVAAITATGASKVFAAGDVLSATYVAQNGTDPDVQAADVTVTASFRTLAN